MSSGASSFHSTLVNAYAGALISVSQTVGVDVVFLKSDITPGVNAPGRDRKSTRLNSSHGS